MAPGATSRKMALPEELIAATTRTKGSGPAGQHLAPGQVLASPHTRLRYRALRLLGAGGFGQVYLARRLGRGADVPATLCVKVGERIDLWVHEAYFGQLLGDHPRAIRVFDAFPIPRPDGRVLKPAAQVDPDYAAGLSRAHAQGVNILVLQEKVHHPEITLAQILPFDLILSADS